MTKPIPYCAHFLGFPVVITAPGQYVTRSGEAVVVDDVRDHHWKKGRYQDGTTERWHSSGRLLSGTQTDNDIVGSLPQTAGPGAPRKCPHPNGLGFHCKLCWPSNPKDQS